MTGPVGASDVAAVVLAAGGSARMGKPKLALPWGDTSILGQVLATYRAAGIDRIVVAVREGDAAAVAAADAAGARWTAVDAPRLGGGPTPSLQAALAELATLAALAGDATDRAATGRRALDREAAGGMRPGAGAAGAWADAVGLLVQPADMPLVTAASVAAVVAAFRALPVADRGQAIIAPSYAGQRGHPVLFGPAHQAALRALAPDRPPRTVVATHHRWVRLVDVPDPGVTLDIDDDAAYRRHCPSATARPGVGGAGGLNNERV